MQQVQVQEKNDYNRIFPLCLDVFVIGSLYPRIQLYPAVIEKLGASKSTT